jgi:hypothetical protein
MPPNGVVPTQGAQLATLNQPQHPQALDDANDKSRVVVQTYLHEMLIGSRGGEDSLSIPEQGGRSLFREPGLWSLEALGIGETRKHDDFIFKSRDLRRYDHGDQRECLGCFALSRAVAKLRFETLRRSRI